MGTSKCNRKAGGGPKPPPNVFPLSIPPPLPLPSTEVDGGINKGWLVVVVVVVLHVLFCCCFGFFH